MSQEMNDLLRNLNHYLMFKDKEGRVVLQLALLATVYFEDPHKREVREAVVSCCEDYFKRCGEHLRWALNPDTETMEQFGKGKGSNPHGWLSPRGEEENFAVIYHGAQHEGGADAFFLDAFGEERRPFATLGHLRVAFPVFWFSEHPGSLVDVLLELCRKLNPASGYGGIGVITSPDDAISADYEHIVCQLAQRFPGLEADYPIAHEIWLADEKTGGIKGVNWLTAIGDRWLAKLGGADALEADLAALDSRFIVHRYPGGVMVQAGPRPDLGDAERGLWPDLYVKLAKKLKPIQITAHGLMQLAGKGPRMDDGASAEAWLYRFDNR